MKTSRDVLREFRGHPEAKIVGPDGRPCGRGTVGLLRRRTVRPVYAVHVGKEANKLEAVESGLEHDPGEGWTEYADPARDPWATLVLPVLRAIPVAELEGLGPHRRSAFAIRAGERLPHPRNRQALTACAASFAWAHLKDTGSEPPSDDLAACAALLVRAQRGG